MPTVTIRTQPVSRKLVLNPGAQEDFVRGDEKFSAYIGGLGSGKTWAGLARGLKYALQRLMEWRLGRPASVKPKEEPDAPAVPADGEALFE